MRQDAERALDEGSKKGKKDPFIANGLSTSTFELLNSVETAMVKYLEDTAEIAAIKTEQYPRNPFYIKVWDTMEDSFPEKLDWFVNIFRKILKLSNEGSSIEKYAINSFFYKFTILFYGSLLPIHVL